jgi:hypothetical protein
MHLNKIYILLRGQQWQAWLMSNRDMYFLSIHGTLAKLSYETDSTRNLSPDEKTNLSGKFKSLLGNYVCVLLRTKLVFVLDTYWCPCVNL